MPALWPRPPIQPYLTIRPVPARLGSCYLWRSPGRVLIAANPGTARIDVVTFIVDNCTLTEQDAYRWHTGQGPVGAPLDEWMWHGVMTHVLPELRLRSEALDYGIDPEWPVSGFEEMVG